MSTDWQDTSWQEEFLDMKAHKSEDVKLLMEGPRGFLDAMKLGSLHEQYKRLKKRQAMNDLNWREELLDSAKFNKKEENLLRHGAKSLAQSWHLGALYIRWKKL